MIEVVTGEQILSSAHDALEVGTTEILGQTYLASAIRRLAGVLCPCSPKTLMRAMLESHRGLFADEKVFGDDIETGLDNLLAIGDLLELKDVAAIDERIKGTWLFAAPPGFVVHHSGTVNIIGLSADEQTPLPAVVRDRVIKRGVARRIFPNEGEDLGSLLKALGLREVSSDSWLRHPKPVSAEDLVARIDAKLSAQGPSGEIEDLRVFNLEPAKRRYRDRWEPSKGKTGRYIVRRPQAYGTDLWGYAELDSGAAIRILDFPGPGERWRGCDVAWRLQMALKAVSERPVTYRISRFGKAVAFDFFSPIPDWSKRSLAFAGEQVAPRSCLLSFDIPISEADAEQRFLQEHLFLSPEHN
jgi:hypothetical protein